MGQKPFGRRADDVLALPRAARAIWFDAFHADHDLVAVGAAEHWLGYTHRQWPVLSDVVAYT